MLLILGLFAGCLVGFMLCAVLGAGKVSDLETDNAYYRDMCIRLRAKLALLEMGEEETKSGTG